MTGKPETFIQSTWSGTALYVNGDRVSTDTLSRHDMRRLLDATVPEGGGLIEYLVCTHVNDHDSNEVIYSSNVFDLAYERLVEEDFAQYLVAVRP